jgi:hypothetical protein
MPAAVTVIPWPDPVHDVLGHDPRSWYAETFWLPTLGPTSLLLMRHLADRFEHDPEGIELPVADTAAALGLGARDGDHSPLMRSLNRLQQFDLACRNDDATIAVRRTLPPVHRRHVRRLPPALQVRHAEWSALDGNAPIDVARKRARRLALMLLVHGERIDTVERTLHSGGFHPAVAYEAVRWAKERHAELNLDDTEPPDGAAPDASPLPTTVPPR